MLPVRCLQKGNANGKTKENLTELRPIHLLRRCLLPPHVGRHAVLKAQSSDTLSRALPSVNCPYCSQRALPPNACAVCTSTPRCVLRCPKSHETVGISQSNCLLFVPFSKSFNVWNTRFKVCCRHDRAALPWTTFRSVMMDAAAEAPLSISNLKSARSDEPIVALGIEGSANKVLYWSPATSCAMFVSYNCADNWCLVRRTALSS